MNIFRIPFKLLESVNDAESHDVKNDRIPFSVLLILIRISNCVGSKNMRRCFLMKVLLIAFYYSPVTFMLFSVDLFDF